MAQRAPGRYRFAACLHEGACHSPKLAMNLTDTQPSVIDSGSSSAPDSEWVALRRSRANDETDLHDRTFTWLATLPASLRPMATARKFPRIVNRIGDLWGHCEYTRLYFQSLLVDRRAGRAGFPPEVKAELVALQQFYFEHLSGLPAILWNAVPVHAVKIPHKVFPLQSHSAEIEVVAPRY